MLALVWSVAVIQYRNPSCDRFYPQDLGMQLSTYTDCEDPLEEGNSKIVDFKVDSSIFLSATIGDKIDYPYAGFRFTMPDSQPFFDISKYDKIEIEIDSTNANFFILDITTYIDGYSHFNDLMSFRHHTAEIFYKSNTTKIVLPMDSIRTQGWWYSLRKINPSKLDKPDFKKCHNLSFEINAVSKRGEQYYMSIAAVTFVKMNKGWAYFAGLVTLLSLCFHLWQWGIIKLEKTSKKNLQIEGRKLEIRNQEDIELERLKGYLSDNYFNPQLSIAQVSRETGVSVDRIPQILMRSYNMQYKQYLNTIRVTEAKRLLMDTDRQISEISIAVGYNYPSTFNRIFKEIVGNSPRDFRKNN